MFALLFIVLALVVPRQAQAQETAQPTDAQFKLYEEGSDAFKSGDYRKAVDLFEASLYLGELNITYLNLGRSHFKLGECPEAARAYELARKAPGPEQPSPSAVRAKIDEYVADLATCPGSVTVTCDVTDELRGKMLVFVGDSGPHECGADPVSVPPGQVVVRATGTDEPLQKTVSVVAMENLEVVFEADGASADVRKHAIAPKGTIRRRKGQMVLDTGSSEPGLLLTLSLGSTFGGTVSDEVSGTAFGDPMNSSAEFTETSGFVIGGSLEWPLASVLSVGASAWYVPAIALTRSSGDSHIGANGDFAEVDLNAVARLYLPVGPYSLYLVGEGGLAVVPPAIRSSGGVRHLVRRIWVRRGRGRHLPPRSKPSHPDGGALPAPGDEPDHLQRRIRSHAEPHRLPPAGDLWDRPRGMTMRHLVLLVAVCLLGVPAPALAQSDTDPLEMACSQGDDDSCLAIAERLHRSSAPADVERARGIYVTLCNKRVNQACFDLGVMYDEAQGVPEDKRRAHKLYQAACRRGYQDACYNLAVVWEKEDAPKRAYKMYQDVCNKGTLAGCVTLGFHYEWGADKLPQDEAKAVALYTRACDLGDGLGCTSLASMHADGRGVQKDLARARSLNDASCKTGNLTGCTKLGLMLERGEGGDKDPDRAQKLFARGCEGGVRMACDLKR